MRILAVALCGAALVFTAGCAQLNADVRQSLHGDYAISPLKVERNGTYAQLVGALTMAPADGVPPLVSASCFGSVPSGDQPSCQASRNAAIAAIMVTSEDLCVAHRKTIYGNDAAANIFFGSLTSLFAGAATCGFASVAHPASSSPSRKMSAPLCASRSWRRVLA